MCLYQYYYRQYLFSILDQIYPTRQDLHLYQSRFFKRQFLQIILTWSTGLMRRIYEGFWILGRGYLASSSLAGMHTFTQSYHQGISDWNTRISCSPTLFYKLLKVVLLRVKHYSDWMPALLFSFALIFFQLFYSFVLLL